MKSFVVLCLVAAAAAAPAPQDVQILRFDNDNIGVGGYNFAYELSDGQRHESRGELRNEGREDAFYAVVGSYAWVGPDGVTYVIRYTADENGYKPEIDQGPGGAVPSGVVAALLG